MLYSHFVKSSFFNFLAQTTVVAEDLGEQSQGDYRIILNAFFRQFVALNKQVETFATENDVCRLRLQNSQLRKEIEKLKGEA